MLVLAGATNPAGRAVPTMVLDDGIVAVRFCDVEDGSTGLGGGAGEYPGECSSSMLADRIEQSTKGSEYLSSKIYKRK